MSPVSVSSIGEYIRQQREQAKISLRQLASAAGVSNPYLSQVERGLRRPSAEILQQIAKGLRISAEALYVQAGILEDRRPDSGVRAAVLADPELAERQKQVLLEIYDSFRRETALDAGPPASGSGETAPAPAGAAGPDPGSRGSAPAGTGTRGRRRAPSTPSTGTPSRGTPSTGTPSTGSPGAGRAPGPLRPMARQRGRRTERATGPAGPIRRAPARKRRCAANKGLPARQARKGEIRK